MNKGKPSGFTAETKGDVGAHSTLRERGGTAGAGPEWTMNEAPPTEARAAGDGGPEQQAGGPEHRGGAPHEDRNP